MMNREVLQLGGCEGVSVVSERLFEIVRAKLWEGNGRRRQDDGRQWLASQGRLLDFDIC